MSEDSASRACSAVRGATASWGPGGATATISSPTRRAFPPAWYLSGMSVRMHRSHRVAGALVGAAVGSALAAPFAGSPFGEFSRRFPLPARGVRTEMCGEDPGRFPPSFARALESLLARDLHTRRLGGPQGDECADLVAEVRRALDGEHVDLDGHDVAEVLRRGIDAGGD